MTESVKKPFQAEVSRVLHLVVHSLYTNKEIFLRELVSNAADALDKLRFRALTEDAAKASLEALPRLTIRIAADKEAGTLTLDDSGIGMTEDELTQNLGTIAHSGSRALLESLANDAKAGAPALIGQFGVGFYSAFLVADRVEVESRAPGSDRASHWVSTGEEGFELSTLAAGQGPERGTIIRLHLKESEREYLEPWRLRSLIEKYSDYVGHPIELVEPGKEPQTINRAVALWRRNKSEITDEQYAEFYKHVAHDLEAPLARTHFTIEGNQEFTALLYLPRKAPFELRTGARAKGVQLFVRRVFIMDDCEALLPQFLRFVRGVVDSDDLPLNVSRESLQDSAVAQAIRRQLTKKVLDLLDTTAADDKEAYATFYEACGSVLKEGVALDHLNRDRIAPLLRYASSHGEATSLPDYVGRMKEGQPAIYFLLGQSQKAAEGSPHVEAIRSRGYEILYMTDPVDEWVVDSLRTFDGKKLVSAMQSDLELPETTEEKDKQEKQKTELSSVVAALGKMLGERVKEVRVSSRLVDSPACLVTSPGGVHPFVERVLRERGQAPPAEKRVLEVNPDHAVITGMKAALDRSPDDPMVPELAELLYDQAVVAEGGTPEDPAAFTRRLTMLMSRALR